MYILIKNIKFSDSFTIFIFCKYLYIIHEHTVIKLFSWLYKFVASCALSMNVVVWYYRYKHSSDERESPWKMFLYIFTSVYNFVGYFLLFHILKYPSLRDMSWTSLQSVYTMASFFRLVFVSLRMDRSLCSRWFIPLVPLSFLFFQKKIRCKQASNRFFYDLCSQLLSSYSLQIFFTPALADSLSLESDWERVSFGQQEFWIFEPISTMFRWSRFFHWFPFVPILFSSVRDRPKRASNNWYSYLPTPPLGQDMTQGQF